MALHLFAEGKLERLRVGKSGIGEAK